jgi:hypothetical protein
VAEEEVGSFKPMAFEKDERNLGTRLATYPVSAEAVVVSRSDLELSDLIAGEVLIVCWGSYKPGAATERVNCAPAEQQRSATQEIRA